MSKFTRRELHQLQDFISACRGELCCSLNEWSTGSGRYKRVKTLPPFVHKISANDMYMQLSPVACTSASKWLHEHKRNIFCLCLDINEFLDFAGKNCLGKEM